MPQRQGREILLALSYTFKIKQSTKKRQYYAVALIPQLPVSSLFGIGEWEWEDDIREWTGLEFAKSQRSVENREKWRKLVVKSSVVPQRPSRLRGR